MATVFRESPIDVVQLGGMSLPAKIIPAICLV